MDEYYQNGPLPTWIGWYLQHLPHWFHAGSALATLVMELGLIWMILLPRGFRIVLFYIVTIWELGVISSANYAFLNYLVLSLGILLVDDRFLLRGIPERWRSRVAGQLAPTVTRQTLPAGERSRTGPLQAIVRRQFGAFKIAFSTVMLIWIFYATTTQLLWMLWPRLHLFTKPVVALETFRVANQYGLFAVMTRGRYEIEFQGSNDGQNWTAYPFRYKPQALNETPRIYAPYQPRFDWNLWFASLRSWLDNEIVPNTELRLLANDQDVLRLFAGNPFPQQPPQQIRALLW